MSKNTNANGNAANDPNHFEGLESRAMMSGTPSATDTALAYDAKGNLHVAYYDDAAHNLKYTVQSAGSGTWSAPVVVDKGSKNVGQQVSLALDKNGLPGIAYRDVANQDLKYAHFDGKKWTVSSVDTKNNAGVNPSLAYDKANHALISYYRPSAKDLQLAQLSGKVWTFSTIATGGSAGQFSSVAINPATGKAAVAFEGSDGKVRYVDAAAKGFTKPIVIDTIAKSGSDLSLSFGTDKKAAFSYYDPSTGDIKLAVKSGKGFTVDTVATVDAGRDPGARVIINPATGKPQVVFYDAANDGVYVADKNGNVDLVGTGGSAGTTVVIDPKTGKMIFTEVSGNGTPGVHDTRVIPAAPGDVSADAVSATRVDVSWSDNSGNEAGFLVERSSDGGATFALVATTSANATSYSDTTAAEGTDYLYRVTAVGTTGVKVAADDVAEVLTLPAGPTNAVATGLSATSVGLTWVNHAASADGNVVERSADGGVSYDELAELAGNATSYQDDTAVEGVTYTYRVTATNDAGDSAGATASVTTLVSAPASLTATSVSAGLVNLSWADTSAHETGYVVQRSADGIAWGTIGTLGANANAFADSTVSAGMQYTYRVKATGAAGSTAYATSAATRVIPAAPVITATTVGVNQVNIAWSAVTGATSYVVERSDDGGDTFDGLGTVESVGYSDDEAAESSTYQYRVRAVNAGGESVNSNVPTATTFLAAPSDLGATAASATQVNLTWTDNSNGETGFVIERSSDGGTTFTTVHTTGAGATSYNDTTATEGVAYVYRIHGVKNANSSDLSQAASATTPMVAPTGLTAAASSLTQVDLAWADNSSNETGYEIYRSTDGGASYALFHTTAAGATSYNDATAAEGHTYSYKVRAVNGIVQSAFTTPQSATTKPAAPTTVAGTVISATRIDLTWADNSNGETGYRVERNAAGAGFVAFQPTLAAGTTSFSDTTATEGVSYAYRVFAVNSAGDSAASNTITAVTLTAAPSSLVATVTGATSVHMTWTDNSTNESGFIVERSPAGGGSFAAVSTLLAADTASFDDTTAAAGTTYVYRVLSVNSASATAASNTQSVLTLPAAATGVAATATSATSLDVTWTAVTGATSYLVERSADAGSTWATVGTPSTNAVSDTGATEGGTFLYRVTSHNATGDGAVSSSSTGVTTIPAAPTGLAATPVTASRVDLAWTDNSGHETGYRVERSSDNGVTWDILDNTLAADTTTFSDLTTSAATSYKYRVIAKGTAGDSAASNVSTALTVPAAPGSANAIASADTHVTLSWTPVTGATGYAIDRSDDSGGTFNELTTVGNVLTSNDLTAAEATFYVYRVRATNATGSSVASTAASVTTLPAAASNLTKTVVSATRVDLAWTDNSGGETGYLIERSSNGGTNYTPLIVLSPDSAAYSDTTAAEGTAYVYRVKPVDITGTGAGVTVNATTIPAAPTSLVATPVSATRVDLTWADNSAHETGYVIERSDDGGTTWPTTHTSAAGATSWSDTDVTGGVTYKYRVHATGAGGDSGLSNVQTVLTVPSTVTDLAVSVVSDAQINVTWTDAAGETGYTLERSNDGGTSWTTAATPAADATSFNDTLLPEGVTYTYRLTSANGTGSSAASNLPAATTLPTAPDTLVATPVNATRVDLTWADHSAHETAFSIDRSTDGGTTWTHVIDAAADATSYSDTGVAAGTSYTYRVRAKQSSAYSADSNLPAVLTIPAAPTTVVATVVDDTHVTLTWDAMHGADSYLVEVSDDGGSTWSTVGTPTAATISHSAATEATHYVYQITAINVTGSSVVGTSNAVMTLAAPVTDLAATPVNAGRIDLAWTDSSNGESAFRIERSPDGSTGWAEVHTTAANAVSWSDTTVAAGTTYYYRIYAVDATADSAVSNVVHKLTHPGQVTGLTATPATDTLVTLEWSAVTGATSYLVEYSDDAGSSWHTVNSTAGTVLGHSTAVEATAYVYRVTASNATGAGVASATQAATTYAALPTGLTVTPTTATNVNISWTDHSHAESNFVIERSDDNGDTWAIVHTNAADAVSWSDTTVTGGNSYVYRVTVTDTTGPSPAVTGSTVLTIPAAVTGFTSSALSTTAMDWTWNASHGATGYLIEVSTDAGSTWSTVTTINDGATTVLHKTGLAEGTSYLYQISPIDDTGSGAASSHTGMTLAVAADTFTATPTTATNIDLAWADNSSGESGYKVQRSDDGGDTWNTVHTTAADATGWSDTVAGGTSHQYRIVATDAGGDSAPTGVETALTVPAAVGTPTVTPVAADEIDLSWTGVTGATLYTVRRSTDNGSTWATAGTSTTASFHDTGRAEASTYTYDVVASDATGAAVDSANVDGLTMPAAPSGLTATGMNTTTIDLAWADDSSGETGYKIERSDDNGDSWTEVHVTAADATSWSDTALTEGHAYVYQVRAYNASGNSVYGDPADGNSAPAAPTAPVATKVTATHVTVTWTDHSGGETGFGIERSDDGGTNWAPVGTTLADVTTFEDESAPEGTALKYRVHATMGSVDSTTTTAANVTTVPAAPDTLDATVVSATEVDLTWADNSANETGYDVYRSVNDGVSWTNVHTTAADATGWNDTAAPEDVALKYKVVATGAGGDSVDSNVVAATTPIAAPTTLTATATSDTSVNLAWTDNSTVETGYKIERSDNGGAFVLIHTSAAGATSYTDSTGVEDVTYTYRVTATDGTVDSTHSNAPSAKTTLAAPTGSSAVSTTANRVDITWANHSAAATGTRIERSDDGGSTWTEINSVVAGVTTYGDTTVAEGTSYKYRVRAANTGNFSAYDGVQTLTTIPATPTTVTGSPFSATRIDVAWADNSGHETGYVIERSADGGTTWGDIHTSAADDTAYSDTTAHEGTDYKYRVRATGAGGPSAESDATSTATSAPAAPTSLVATPYSANQVDLTWVDNSGGETAYVIERSTDNGVSFSALATVSSADQTSYSDMTAAESTQYVYRLRADRDSSQSTWSNSSTQVLTHPAAASDFAVTTPTSTRAVLTWTDNSGGETGYRVMRSTDGGIHWNVLNTTVANATSYSDNTVTEGGSYAYRVIAFNTTGDSTPSNVGVANMAPASPNGISASAANPHRVDLAWTDRSNAETGFKIERSTNGGATWTQIDTVVADVTNYSDTTVSEGTNYQYRVRAYADGGNSGYTSTATALTPLVAPTGLTPTVVSATRVDLAWTDNSSAESQYKVERSAAGANTWGVIATVAANSTTYSDTTGAEGHAYDYRVRAARTGNTSAYTSVATATTLPAAPSAISATVASDTQVNLTWSDNSSGETGFVVERFDGTTWTQVGSTLAANANSYNDTTAAEGTAYSYRVKAVNAGGSSAFSTSSSVTTLPAAPTVLVASSPFGDTVELTWTDNSAHETGYAIERSDDSGSTWNQIGTTTAGGTFYADFTVDEGATYQYRVRANQSAANSAYSNTQTVTTVPLMPSDLAATTVSATRIDLAWTDNSAGETSYKIERSDDGGLTFTEIDSIAADSTTYSDTTVTEGLYYQYRIRAHNAGGYSGYSDSVDALTLPAAPTAMTVTASFYDEVDLAWTDNSVGEDGFILERRVDGGTWDQLDTPGPDVHTYADFDVSTGHTYDYRVRSYNSAGESANSNTDSATPPAAP